MARIQQSIEINVPVHTVYNQLRQFEDYPRFMTDIEAVHQVDDTHLHWATKLTSRNMEWDAEITEQVLDRCIAWRNVNGPQNAGKVELQPLGQERSRVILTMECEPVQLLASQDVNTDAAIADRIGRDLARFKQFIEMRSTETGDSRGGVHRGAFMMQAVRQDRDMYGKTQGDALEMAVGLAAGSRDAGRPGAQGQDLSKPSPSAQPVDRQTDATMQSAASLSQSSDQVEDGRFSVAEEQNFDQQSDQARRVGQMPQGRGPGGMTGVNPSDAMAKSMKRDKPDAKE